MARLDVPQDCQLGVNWCWAAASVSVTRFYEKASEWTQCRIAARVLGDRPVGSCCTHEGPGDCGGGGPPAAADAAVERAREDLGFADAAGVRGARPDVRLAGSERLSLPVYVMPAPRPDQDPAEPHPATELGWRYVEVAQPSPLEVWNAGDGTYVFAAAGTERARQRLDSALVRAIALVEGD